MSQANDHIEGPWEELVRHSERFAGKRVRVTVLPEKQTSAPSLQSEFRHWLTEGDALQSLSDSVAKPGLFDDALADKFRKQGLVF